MIAHKHLKFPKISSTIVNYHSTVNKAINRLVVNVVTNHFAIDIYIIKNTQKPLLSNSNKHKPYTYPPYSNKSNSLCRTLTK